VAITNGYSTLAELKAALTISDATDDAALEAAINAVSRMIDDYTGRFFYKDGTTQSPVARYYTALDPWTMNVDDITTITQIATDDNFNQLWDTVWATSDYMVEPINNPRRGWPFTRILAIGRYVWPYYLPQACKITGVWGWSAVPYEVQSACLIQSSRIFVRRQSPFGIAGTPELGTVRLTSRLDPDVEALLRPFRKNNGLAK
jgi:hypothetical protein